MKSKKLLVYVTFWCFCMVSAAVIGCVNIEKTFPNITYYALDVQPGEKVSRAEGITLEVQKVTFSPRFERKQFVYRQSEHKYVTDFYNQFFVAPAALMTEEIRRWCQASPVVTYVRDASGTEPVDYSIKSKVLALYGDYQDPSKPLAVIEMQFSLFEEQDVAPAFMFTRTYKREIHLERRSAEALVKGWNKGLRAILGVFETDLGHAVQ